MKKSIIIFNKIITASIITIVGLKINLKKVAKKGNVIKKIATSNFKEQIVGGKKCLMNIK